MIHDNIDELETKAEKAITKLAEAALEHSKDAAKWRNKYKDLTEREADFEKSLTNLINFHSEEGASNTPDYILAQYMRTCLHAFNVATQQRETHYGRDDRPSCTHDPAIVYERNMTDKEKAEHSQKGI